MTAGEFREMLRSLDTTRMETVEALEQLVDTLPELRFHPKLA